MKEFHVFHSNNFSATIHGGNGAVKFWAENRGDYTRVAVVDADTLDDAYRLTNHIDCSWWENEGVKKAVDVARSTSVGDIICQVDNNGVALFMVDTFGFTEVG